MIVPETQIQKSKNDVSADSLIMPVPHINNKIGLFTVFFVRSHLLLKVKDLTENRKIKNGLNVGIMPVLNVGAVLMDS